jgi:hypothetical protein
MIYMTQVTGVIEATTDKFGKFNVLMDNGKWYSTNPERAPNPRPVKGQTITFDSGSTGKYLNSVRIEGGAPTPAAKPASNGVGGKPAYRANGEQGGFPVHPLAYERALDRRNALTNAVAFYAHFDEALTPDNVIAVARKFEAYTTGDLDLEEAKREMGIA